MTVPSIQIAPKLLDRVSEQYPMYQPDAEALYKSVRNRLRKYSAASIAEAALRILWNPPANKLEELRTAPWLTLLIVKWALQDNEVALMNGPPIPMSEFDRTRQELWSSQHNPNAENVFLMLRSITHVQMEFQRPENWGFLRWPALYARLDANHKSRRQFLAVFEMEPEVFIDLSYYLFAVVLQNTMPFRRDCLEFWRKSYGPAVDKIFAVFARDLAGVRTELNAPSISQRGRRRQELYEFPHVKRFPLLLMNSDEIHCWHRLVFARGVEEIVHLNLSEKYGSVYTESFSKVFENYVAELAVELRLPYLAETAYKQAVGHFSPSVECILEGQDCNILVEAKMSLFADDIFLQDYQAAIFRKTKRVREGVEQGWRVGKLIRESPNLRARFSKPQDFLLVVTSRDLSLGGGEMLQRLFSPGDFEYPELEAAHRLPLSNVFIVSIEDFENIVGCVKSGEVDLSVLLKEASENNKRGETARTVFSDFLGNHTRRWTQSQPLAQARAASEERTHRAFGA